MHKKRLFILVTSLRKTKHKSITTSSTTPYVQKSHLFYPSLITATSSHSARRVTIIPPELNHALRQSPRAPPNAPRRYSSYTHAVVPRERHLRWLTRLIVELRSHDCKKPQGHFLPTTTILRYNLRDLSWLRLCKDLLSVFLPHEEEVVREWV